MQKKKPGLERGRAFVFLRSPCTFPAPGDTLVHETEEEIALKARPASGHVVRQVAVH